MDESNLVGTGHTDGVTVVSDTHATIVPLSDKSIRSMPAGPEMDALISDRIFRKPMKLSTYVVINGQRIDWPTWLDRDESPDNPGPGAHAGMTPLQYSTNMACAATVMEKLKLCLIPHRRGWLAGQHDESGYVADSIVDIHLLGEATAETPAHAIGRSALLLSL